MYIGDIASFLQLQDDIQRVDVRLNRNSSATHGLIENDHAPFGRVVECFMEDGGVHRAALIGDGSMHGQGKLLTHTIMCLLRSENDAGIHWLECEKARCRLWSHMNVCIVRGK